jgi:predicted ArsR family transcriptional regulator
MKTSRQKVLDYFHSHPVASPTDISISLKMTQANARHHINILLSQRLLEKAGERQPEGKGRPNQLFRLSTMALGDNVELLLHATLSILNEQQTEEEFRQTIRQLASYMLSSVKEKSIANPTRPVPLSQKLIGAIELLNQLNYQARWEAHRDGPRILLGRCPYQKIIQQHPEICLLDHDLLEMITSAPVQQNARLAKDPSGATYCLFKLSMKHVQ